MQVHDRSRTAGACVVAPPGFAFVRQIGVHERSSDGLHHAPGRDAMRDARPPLRGPSLARSMLPPLP